MTNGEEASRFQQYINKLRTSSIVGIFISAGILVFAIWYSTAGRWTTFFPSDNAYVDLGEAFLHGQLSLFEKPNPQLLTLANPYDPTQRVVYYRWDFSYYEGKYYLYWGPVPALIIAAIKGIFRTWPPGSLMVFISYSGLSVICLAILHRLKRLFHDSAPDWTIGIFLLLGFINLPFLFLLGRPVIYETSIITGQLFLISGLTCWILFATGSNKTSWLIMAGLCWGLAIGSRYNLIVSVALFIFFVLIHLRRHGKGHNDWKKFGLILVPLIICLAALGAYNFARFGEPLETGWSYQLSLPEVQGEYISLEYIPSNLYAYLIFPMKTSQSFPFIISTLPPGRQIDELTAGLLPSVPGIWLLILALPLFMLKKAGMSSEPKGSNTGRSLVAMIVLGASVQAIFLLVFFYAAMRYVADFYLMAIIGTAVLCWRADHLLRTKPVLRFSFWLSAVILTLWTAGIGFFGGFDIPSGSFRPANPALYDELASFWNHLYRIFSSLF